MRIQSVLLSKQPKDHAAGAHLQAGIDATTVEEMELEYEIDDMDKVQLESLPLKIRKQKTWTYTIRQPYIAQRWARTARNEIVPRKK